MCFFASLSIFAFCTVGTLPVTFSLVNVAGGLYALTLTLHVCFFVSLPFSPFNLFNTLTPVFDIVSVLRSDVIDI